MGTADNVEEKQPTVPHLPAIELRNDHDGAKRLLPSDVHVVSYVRENRGLKEKPCRHSKPPL